MAQSVKQPTLDFGSGLDLTVREFKPHVGLCANIMEPAWDNLLLSLPFPCSPSPSPSPSKIISKINFKNKSFQNKISYNTC